MHKYACGLSNTEHNPCGKCYDEIGRNRKQSQGLEWDAWRESGGPSHWGGDTWAETWGIRVGWRCGPRPLQASKPPCTLKLYFIVTDTEAYELSNMPSDGAASEGRKSSRVCLTCCSVPVTLGRGCVEPHKQMWTKDENSTQKRPPKQKRTVAQHSKPKYP